ncbi:unnamed protein product, partial [Didymodactylos carnosus]
MAYAIDSTNSRYTDVRDEPVEKLLTPISGHQDQPSVSLKEAVQPIAHLFNGLKDYVLVAKHNCKNPAEGLSQDESGAIHLYTMEFDPGPSLYEILNKRLRAENRENLKPWFLFLKLFLSALEKLPSATQTVYRGIKGVDQSDKYINSEKFVWWGVSSCTLNIEPLQSEKFLGKFGQRTLFSIDSKN